MIDRLRRLGIFPGEADAAAGAAGAAPATTALRLFSAELFFTTGANATLHYLRGAETAGDGGENATEWHAQAEPGRRRLPLPAAIAPAVVGTLAGATQALRALRPDETNPTLGRVLNGAAVGLGVAGLAASLGGALRGGGRSLTLAPLLFGYAGVLGFLLDRHEARVEEELEELERRARIVKRFVSRRRPKLERIVVHV